jgi:hypothetical protein
MAESVATPAATEPAAAPAEGQKPAEDILDIVLEGMDKPVKVPVSKIPLDKLNPHLAKLRSEADRRMSEADRRTKELDERGGRYSTIDKLAEAIKQDPDAFLRLGRELGLSEEQLYTLSEGQVAARIRAQLRDQEEQQDPSKKTAREQQEELDQLRKDKQEFEKQREQETRARFKGNLEGLMVQALDKLPASLKLEAAREMTNILRAAVDSDRMVAPEELAQAARDALRRRARFVNDSDEDMEFTDKQLERAKAALAKREQARPRHPSEVPNPGASARPPKKNGTNGQNSSDLLLTLLHGKR